MNIEIKNEYELVEYVADLPDHFIIFIKKNNLTLTKNFQTHLDSF